MPFGEHSTDRMPGTSRGARARSTARDASIDEILKSIQQIIDEEPLTAKGGNFDTARPAARLASIDRPAGAKPVAQPLRKRPARLLRTAAEDDILAELLAPQPEAAMAAFAVAITQTAPASVVTPEPAREPEPVALSEPMPQPLVDEPDPMRAASDDVPPDVTEYAAHALATPEPLPEKVAELEPVQPAPAAAIVVVEPRMTTAIAVAAPEPPVEAEPLVEASEPQPITELDKAADALLQSLAAGLGLGGFDVGASTLAQSIPDQALPVEQPNPIAPAVAAAPATDAPQMTPQEAAAAAVAEVAAANAEPVAVKAPEATLASVEAPLVVDAAADSIDDIFEEPALEKPAAMSAEPAAATLEQSPSTVGDAVALPAALADGLDDAIATMLRPLLREWLDAHLPRMVEKALKEELRDRPLAGITSASA